MIFCCLMQMYVCITYYFRRSNNGMTPVHVVAYTCNLNIMNELLAAGGDLRLHDSTGRSSKEFAFLQPEQKKRMKMLEFLEKTRLFALTKSGRDLRASLNGPRHNHRYAGNQQLFLLTCSFKFRIQIC